MRAELREVPDTIGAEQAPARPLAATSASLAARLALCGIVLLAAALRCWRIDAGSFIVPYYLAGVRSQLESWHNFFFNAFDPAGRTPLMYAAGSDRLPLDVVKLLIERGADVNAKDQHKLAGDAGLTPLEIARLHGDTPIVDFLVKSGAKGSAATKPALKTQSANTIQSALQRTVPLLQRQDANFAAKAGCVSCHNNSLPATAVALARRSGSRVDEHIAANQVKVNVDENPDITIRYGVRSIPTLIMFKNGEPTAMQVGAVPKSRLADWIKQAV